MTIPEAGAIVEDIAGSTLREIYVKSYRLIYRITPARIDIAAVIHGARDFARLWLERNQGSEETENR